MSNKAKNETLSTTSEPIKIKDIKLSKCNARTHNKEEIDESIKELSDSIKKNNLINRLILRKNKDEYEIIAGYRRLKALEILYGPEYEIPPKDYIILNVEDDLAYIISLTENVKRVNLSPIDLNKAYLILNEKGYKDKEIANILGIPLNRLKRLSYLSSDLNKIPEKAKIELSKPIEISKFNDLHWDKIREEDDILIKDAVDYIINNEIPPRNIPEVLKTIKEKSDYKEEPEKEVKNIESKEDIPIEYTHKGELILDQGKLKVISKKEEEEIPIDHYLEYLKHPSKFKCFVSFKLKIKPIIE